MASQLIQIMDAEPELLMQRKKMFEKLEEGTLKQPRVIEEVSPLVYRQMRDEGSNGFVKPSQLSDAVNILITARDGYELSLRIIRPTSGDSKGMFLHFHAGSLVYGSATGQDKYLLQLANAWNLTAISVEYRLAPEYPWPTAKHDAVDAALFALSADGSQSLTAGGPLRIIVGESAGGFLAAWTVLSLRDEFGVNMEICPLQGLICVSAIFHPAGTPSLLAHTRACIVSREDIIRCNAIAFTGHDHADVSLLNYQGLGTGPLPAALFLCGTADPALDDSVLMGVKWRLARSENISVVKMVPGAWHAFPLIPTGETQAVGLDMTISFGKDVLLKIQNVDT